MITLSNRMQWAVSAMIVIAASGDRPAQQGAISVAVNCPKRYLEPMLQALVKRGVLLGVRGPRGGYKLARDPKAISFADIEPATIYGKARDWKHPLGAFPGVDIALEDLSARWRDDLRRISIHDVSALAEEPAR